MANEFYAAEIGYHFCTQKKGKHTVSTPRCEACGMVRSSNMMLMHTEPHPVLGDNYPEDWKVQVDPTPTSALDVQVNGSHYKSKRIQPVEYITANNLTFLEGCIVKRITRWRDKDGFADLEKIKHEVDLLIELEKRYADTTN